MAEEVKERLFPKIFVICFPLVPLTEIVKVRDPDCGEDPFLGLKSTNLVFKGKV